MTTLAALSKYFGHKEFRPGQQEIIDEIVHGNNVLAVLPTGAGKSICFQIPALINDNYSIVISPLIALMKDQVDALNKSTEIAAFINSTQSFNETEKVLQEIHFGKLKIVYVAPERLESPEFAARLKNLNPEFLFIDEAHCISEWGHNFRPSYTKLKDFIEFTGIKKISAFTATATPEVVKDIVKQLGMKNAKVIIKGFERDNLFVNVEITKRKKERCLELVHQFKSPAIIYTSSRKKAEELSEYLKHNKIECEYYHAGLNTIVRKKIQEDFIEDRLPIIIATNAFGMGIDKKDIRLVIHFNTTGSIENFYQEIGRAGRDGKNSHTFLLFEDSDIHIHEYFISNSYPTKELIKSIYNAICDSAQIAIGMKSDKQLQINLGYIKLHTKQDISAAILNSALNYLENASYISINSAYKSVDKIKILFTETRLKSFIKSTSNELMRDVLFYLIRNYGKGIFHNLTALKLDNLKSETGLTKQETTETLINLEFLGIIEFSKADGKESISLIKPRVRTEELKLNYKLINELYISSKQKLDKMVDFVYTNNCRFSYIIKYFGEDASDYKCGKCDNCLKQNGIADDSIKYIKENIEDLLNEDLAELSENQIADILLGKSKNIEHKNYQHFNSLTQYKKEDISYAIRILISENKIQEKSAVSNKLYYIVRDDEKQVPVVEQIGSLKSDFDKNIEMYHRLRKVREKASKKFLQSPNIICPDDLLAKISHQKPKTKSELFSIPGFNERMFNKVGNDFLEVINSFGSVNVDKKGMAAIIIPQNIIETHNLLQKKYSLQEIAKLRKLNEAVISMQIETIISYLPETNISSIITTDKLNLITEKYRKGITGLKELKEVLPKDLSYPQIRIALAKISHQSF
ncbi:MAG: RecQ family ATP-dependent DNA helicase [Ignavibacteriales bacterium]|nr:RecQ family ATP-dependent DNA helicase [Ignavibacteriales bacterium]